MVKMKKINKLIAVILAFAMLVGAIPVRSFASDNSDNYYLYSDKNNENLTLEEYSKTDEAKIIYASLSDKAKKIFDNDLNELIREEKSCISVRAYAATLSSLNLPGPVLYSLQAMMSGFVAATADGPLPFGDAMLVVASVAAVGTLAIYWDEVAPKWNSIVNVFKNKFQDSVSTVNRVFSKVNGEAKKKAKSKPTGRKVKDVHKRLRKEGFEKTGQKGSHEQREKGDKKVTVPNHGEKSDLPLGTLRSIWKQAGWI
ncbi:type II toxin-antitoxin system HicA family toxin [Citroniella saccharovorans]